MKAGLKVETMAGLKVEMRVESLVAMKVLHSAVMKVVLSVDHSVGCWDSNLADPKASRSVERMVGPSADCSASR